MEYKVKINSVDKMLKVIKKLITEVPQYFSSRTVESLDWDKLKNHYEQGYQYITFNPERAEFFMSRYGNGGDVTLKELYNKVGIKTTTIGGSKLEFNWL